MIKKTKFAKRLSFVLWAILLNSSVTSADAIDSQVFSTCMSKSNGRMLSVLQMEGRIESATLFFVDTASWAQQAALELVSVNLLESEQSLKIDAKINNSTLGSFVSFNSDNVRVHAPSGALIYEGTMIIGDSQPTSFWIDCVSLPFDKNQFLPEILNSFK